jgi:hypothetical protein
MIIGEIITSLSALLDIFSKIKSFFTKKKDHKKQILRHSFFSHMDYWITVAINNIPIENPLKKKYIKQFLSIKFKTFKDNSYKWISTNFDNEDCNADIIINTLLLDSIKECEDKCLKLGVPKIIVEKLTIWDHSKLHVINSAIQDICNSKFYTNSHDKKAAILDILQAAFHLIVIDSEKTLNILNGDVEAALIEHESLLNEFKYLK